jgi:hypothetical protein
MSDTAAKKKIRVRRGIVRAVLILAYVGIMVFSFVMGKGHTILIDNKDSADGAYKAFEDIRVAVDSGADSEYASGDREMAKVQGQIHRIIIDKQDGSAKIEKTIRLPLGANTVLLSLPKLVAGALPYLEPFEAKTVAPAEEEAPATADGSVVAPASAAPASSDTSSASNPSGSASSTSSSDGSSAVFFSQPGGQGTATTGSSTGAKGATGSTSASSSDDSGGAVFFSQPGGQGTESH